MSSPLNPINVRIPFFDLSTEEGRQTAHRYLASGIVDLNQAIAALVGKPASSVASVTQFFGGTEKSGIMGSLGAVNDQRGETSYATQQSDNGAKIILGDVSPIAVTLTPTVNVPWYTIIDNDSGSTASLAPGSPAGLIGDRFIDQGCFAIVYFDGSNFWCGATRIATDSTFGYVEPDGVTISVDSGIISTAGASGTVTLAALSGGGTQGKIVFSDGLITSFVAPT